MIGPGFFSYLESIAYELSNRGFECMVFSDRHSNGKIAKIMYRIGFYDVFSWAKKRHLKSIYNQIVANKISDVLLINVEGCDRNFIQNLIKSNVSISLYMWDSSKNKANFLSYIDLIEAKSSFDPQDCETFGLKYIPLFGEFGLSPNHHITQKNIDIYFCGTVHSNRPKIIYQILKFSIENKLKFISHNYYHNKFLFFIKSLAYPYGLAIFKSVTNKSLSKSKIFESMSLAKFVLDIQHNGQKGLTARTFEALRCGAHLITTNDFALKLPHGLKNRITVFNEIRDLQNINFNDFEGSPLTVEQDYYLSLQRFVDDIIVLMSMNRRNIDNMHYGQYPPHA